MITKIEELSEKKNKLVVDAQVMLDSGLSTPEQKHQYRSILTDIDVIQSDIDSLRKIERKLGEQRSTQPTSTSVASFAIGTNSEQRRAKVNAAWRGYLKGTIDATRPEYRDILTAGTGAPTIPLDFQSDFLSIAKSYYAPLLNYAKTRTSNGYGVKIAKVDDRANGLILLTEGSSTPVPEIDPTSFASTTVSTDLLTTGQVPYSVQLLEDAGFDLVKLISDLGASRVGRGLSSILTNGLDTSGTATPNNPGLVNIAQTGATTTALANGIGWTDLITLFDSVNEAYLPKSVWQMSSKTRNTLLKSLDGQGRPFFVPSPTVDGVDMLLGKPIVINQSLGQIGVANSVPVIFGSLAEGFEVVTTDIRVQNLTERYMDKLMNTLIITTRVGSTALAPGALQKLVLASS